MVKTGITYATRVISSRVTLPLSPLLFVLVIEALNALFRCAEERRLFSSLRSSAIRQRVSLYADDLMIFLTPQAQDIKVA
jgi:hypothetical protein